jgi:hypothetical protein
MELANHWTEHALVPPGVCRPAGVPPLTCLR